ncbi:natterin-4-like [Wyeomyia smithii]|uniref:natterin-4-like n=1 Tax=Wyeomyia smithii TaxID=174621 RepID=UPI0024681685|nr:natterin-4-like [Wyeomyia smithii]
MEWSADDGIPQNALVAGLDQDGSPLYVARAHHEGDLIPGKFIPNRKQAFVSYGGLEVFKSDFEILFGYGFIWVSSSNGRVPKGAVEGGRTASKESLYIGRAHHEGSLTPGKIHPSHGCLYIPFGGSEQLLQHYEVLIWPPVLQPAV